VARALASRPLVLQRHLDRVVGGLGAAGDEPDLAEPSRRKLLDDQPGALLLGIGREGVGRRVGDPTRLFRDRRDDLRHAVPDRGDRRRAAGPVDVAPALGVVQVDALAPDDRRVGAMEVAVQDRAGHGVHRFVLLATDLRRF